MKRIELLELGTPPDVIKYQEVLTQVVKRPLDAQRGAVSLNDAAQLVKERVIAMDGEARWALDDAVLQTLEKIL